MKRPLVIATTAATLLLPLFALTASAQTTNNTGKRNAIHGKGAAAIHDGYPRMGGPGRMNGRHGFRRHHRGRSDS